MEICIKWNLCRICLKKRNDCLESLYTNEATANLIYECSGISMKHNDGLPDKICSSCLSELHLAYNFRTKCRNSDVYLKSAVDRTYSATTLLEYNKNIEVHGGNLITDASPTEDLVGSSKNSRNEGIKNAAADQHNDFHIKDPKEELIQDEIAVHDADFYRDKEKILHISKEEYDCANDDGNTEEKNSLDYDNYYLLVDEDNVGENHDSGDVVENLTDETINGSEDYEMIQVVDEESEAEHNSSYKSITIPSLEYLIEDDHESDSTSRASSSQFNALAGVQKIIYTKKLIAKTPVSCSICGNVFTTRNLLNTHMRTHRTKKSYECELCFKKFTSSSNLTAHIRIHTGEKPFICLFCHRRFSDRGTQLKHERTHTNEKPFHCPICSKSFSLSSTLRAHEVVHNDEKPYRCNICERGFKLPHQLKAHKVKIHKFSEEPAILG